MGDAGNEGTGERSLLKKLRKTFMRGWIQDWFVQGRGIDNLVLFKSYERFCGWIFLREKCLL